MRINLHVSRSSGSLSTALAGLLNDITQARANLPADKARPNSATRAVSGIWAYIRLQGRRCTSLISLGLSGIIYFFGFSLVYSRSNSILRLIAELLLYYYIKTADPFHFVISSSMRSSIFFNSEGPVNCVFSPRLSRVLEGGKFIVIRGCSFGRLRNQFGLKHGRHNLWLIRNRRIFSTNFDATWIEEQ